MFSWYSVILLSAYAEIIPTGEGAIMAQKVYWKGLELTLNLSLRYIQRNQINLSKTLTTAQYNCLLDLLTALTTCLAILPPNTPTPP